MNATDHPASTDGAPSAPSLRRVHALLTAQTLIIVLLSITPGIVEYLRHRSRS